MATSELIPVPRDVNAERSKLQKSFEQGKGFSSNPINRELQQKLREIDEDMRQQGVYPAMIVNYNPFPLTAQGPKLAGIVIPACKPPADSACASISWYVPDIIDKGGRYDARAILPIVLARDFVRQQQEFGRGGVACYGGQGDLGKMPPNDKRLPQEVKDLLARAKEEMFAQCERLAQEAQQEWSRPNGVGKLNVDDRHRKAFEVLSAYKLWLGKVPEWAVSTRNPVDVMEPCPRCGAEPVAKAFQCAKCGEWIRAYEAYEEGYLDKDEPGGKLALSRLTKEQLEELGLYPEIRPLSETRTRKPKVRPQAK